VGCVELKILVTGSYNAGKSAFIHRITHGTSFSIDRAGTTVAMDHGATSAFGVMIHLFGTPGLRRFSVLRKILAQGADGIILMIDSTDPSSFGEIRSIYQEVREYLPTAPMVCCANKQDLEGALSLAELTQQLDFTKDLLKIETSALTGLGVDEALKIVTLAILRRLQKTLKTVDRVGKDGLTDLAKALEKNKVEARLLLQWLSWRRLLIADWDRQQFSLAPRIREIIDIFEIIEDRKILERNNE